MADLVGSYALATFTTPVNAAVVTAATLRGNYQTIATAFNSHDADPSLHWQTTTFAGLPGTGTASKAKYVTTDTRRVYLDLTGSGALSELAYLPTTGGTLTGALAGTSGAFSGALTAASGVFGTDPGGAYLVRAGGSGRLQSASGTAVELLLVQNTVESWGIGMDAASASLRINQSATTRLTISSAGVMAVPGGVSVGTATLLTTSVALTAGGGASTGTLTNAPSAGNPVKWISIVDNGTTRWIPTW